VNTKKEFFGKIIIVGKSNVGKSTLFNKLLERKISITSSKSNTTQKILTGIHTVNEYQSIYIDTPGIVKRNKSFLKKLDKVINKLNLVLFVVEHIIWNYNDENILNKLKNYNIPILLVFNKIDKLNNKKLLLPHINFLLNKFNFYKFIPVSSKKNQNIHNLSKIIQHFLPQESHQHSNNYFTNSSFEFIISEMIREKFIRNLNKEIPYTVKVLINSLKINQQKEYIIYGLVLVNNNRHKKIVIGSKGIKIKLCNIQATKEIEKFVNKKVKLFLKVIKK